LPDPRRGYSGLCEGAVEIFGRRAPRLDAAGGAAAGAAGIPARDRGYRGQGLTVMHQPAPRITYSETSWRYPGWRVVLVCFVMALFCWGFGFYGHAVYLAELQRLHGWPAAVISGATTVYYFGSAILVVFVSDAISRLGARGMVLAGIACLTVSL